MIVNVLVIGFVPMSIGYVTAAIVGVGVGIMFFDAIKINVPIIIVVVTGKTLIQIPSRFPSIEF